MTRVSRIAARNRSGGQSDGAKRGELQSPITERYEVNLPNVDEEPVEDEGDSGRWLIIIRLRESVLFGFTNEIAARAAYVALSKAVTNEDDGAELVLQERDENGNWLTIDSCQLP